MTRPYSDHADKLPCSQHGVSGGPCMTMASANACCTAKYGRCNCNTWRSGKPCCCSPCACACVCCGADPAAAAVCCHGTLDAWQLGCLVVAVCQVHQHPPRLPVHLVLLVLPSAAELQLQLLLARWPCSSMQCNCDGRGRLHSGASRNTMTAAACGQKVCNAKQHEPP